MQLWGSQARTAVCSAHQALTNTPLTPCNQLHFGSPLVNSSVCMADVLSNTPVGSELYSDVAKDGLVLVEPFGNLAVLAWRRSSVQATLSPSTSTPTSPRSKAQHLSFHRVLALSLRFPRQSAP